MMKNGSTEVARSQECSNMQGRIGMRRGWDSNPRYGFPHARFRGEYFKPLSHLSRVVAAPIVAEPSIARQCVTRRQVLLCFSASAVRQRTTELPPRIRVRARRE